MNPTTLTLDTTEVLPGLVHATINGVSLTTDLVLSLPVVVLVPGSHCSDLVPLLGVTTGRPATWWVLEADEDGPAVWDEYIGREPSVPHTVVPAAEVLADWGGQLVVAVSLIELGDWPDMHGVELPAVPPMLHRRADA